WALPCLVTLIACWSCPLALGGTIHPYYQRRLPTPQIESDFASDTFHIDLANAHIPEYGASNTVAEANRLFDKRAAAAVRNSVGIDVGVRIWPEDAFTDRDLLEIKSYGDEAPTIYI